MSSPQSQRLQVYQTRSRTNEQRIKLLEKKLGNKYEFKDKLLALEALQVSGQPQQIYGQTLQATDNKGLAILGDQLLDFHLASEWRDTGLSREAFSDVRTRVASNKALSKVGRDRGIDTCVIRRSDAMQDIGYISMATTIEAVIAAVYFDAEKEDKGTGMDAVRRIATELGLNFRRHHVQS